MIRCSMSYAHNIHLQITVHTREKPEPDGTFNSLVGPEAMIILALAGFLLLKRVAKDR